MADIIAIIPARSGSKGVPDKNIRLLAGKPLLTYSIVAARLVESIGRVIVSTDSQHYTDIAKEYGAEVPFLRPRGISDDGSSVYEYIKHTLDWIKDHEGNIPKYIVLLLPTIPLREVAHIEKAIRYMMASDNACGLRSVHEMSETAYKTLEIENGYLKCICTGSLDINVSNRPRQEFPITYQPNGYVDVIRSSYVMEKGEVFGDKVIAYVTPRTSEVDTLEDFEYLEYQVDRKPAIVRSLFGGVC